MEMRGWLTILFETLQDRNLISPKTVELLGLQIKKSLVPLKAQTVRILLIHGSLNHLQGKARLTNHTSKGARCLGNFRVFSKFSQEHQLMEPGGL